ncbi:MAG: primosomal protein [Symploca sp. SIO3C6]|uniref:Primosomal protein n=1 Tax=Symploca sp. SIO1C4 TaxID=2607765 RepID=A0A6B3NFJ9_9CYAN|nr:primosomal protein [Symploca sp. SIO3C6]NEO99554.1 primosomal protein [Symploca sp. SIO2E9]NER30447.1 primosomal protein [Symploca sp. SIO1C4]
MVTTRKKTTKSSAKSTDKSNDAAIKTKNSTKLTPSQQAEALVKKIRNAIHTQYKVKLATRDSRIATKVGHAVREKLGLDIQAQMNKWGNGKKFDWQEWNNKVFPKLFGKPDALKVNVEVLALAMSMLYDTISEDTEAAINDLIDFNAKSLARRNGFAKDSEEELEDEEFDEDDEDDDIDDLLEELDDEDDEEGSEDEDFEIDEEEEFDEEN